MKKYFNIILYIITAFFIWGCDDNDFDTNISYIFTTELQLPEEGTINNSNELKLKLSSEIYKSDLLKHQFFFTDTKKACLINAIGDTIYPSISTPIPMTDAFLEYNFVGLAEGIHTVKFTFTNEKGYKTEIEKNITINLANYTFEATGSNIGALKTPKYISVNLTPDISQPQDTKYKVKFKINNVVGTLSLNGKNLEENTYFEYSKGTSIFTFIPTILTENAEIEFTCVDSYGQTKTSKISFKVQEAGFNFTMLLSSPSVILNQKNQIDFNITPIDASSASKYQMKFSTSGKATLGGHTPSEEWFDVNKGDFNLKYLPTTTGIHTINVFVKDDYGSIINKELVIDVVPNQFSFTVAPTSNSPEINTLKTMNFNITPIGDDTGQKYKLKYEVLQGEGELYNTDKTTIKPNTLIEVNKGDFNLNFKATTGGSIKIKFYAINTDNFTVAKEITLSVIVPNFNFTASFTNATQIVKQPNLINYAINPIGDIPQSFEIKFEDDGDGTLNGNNKGVWFDISQGNGTLTFIPTTSGTHSIKLTVRNKIFLTEKSITLSVNVEYHKFDFNVTDENSIWKMNFANPLTFNIMPVGNDEGQDYELMYQVIQGKGTLSGFTALEYKKVQKGSFKIQFTPNTGGTLTINFKVRNKDGVTIEKTLNIYNIVIPNFELTTPNVAISDYQGTDINIPFSIINNQTGDTDFYVTLDKVPDNGYIKFNGQLVSANTLHKISDPNNFQITYRNNKIENITLTVKAKNQITDATKQIAISTIAQSFSYNLSKINDVKVGKNQTFNIAINSPYNVKYYAKFSSNSGGFTINESPLNTWVEITNKDKIFTIKGSSFTTLNGANLNVQVKDEFGNIATTQSRNFTVYDDPIFERTNNKESAFYVRGYKITDLAMGFYVTKVEHTFKVIGRPYNISKVIIYHDDIPQKSKDKYPDIYGPRELFFGSSNNILVNDIRYIDVNQKVSWYKTVNQGEYLRNATIEITDQNGNFAVYKNY